jgi:hypothetical protein
MANDQKNVLVNFNQYSFIESFSLLYIDFINPFNSFLALILYKYITLLSLNLSHINFLK